MLDNFVLQGRNAQGTLASIRFRDVGSLGRLRAIRPLMQPTVETGQLDLEVRLILVPRQAIDTRRGCSLECVEAVLKPRHRHMVEQAP